MRKIFFKILFKLNKLFLPKLGKLDLNNLSKPQKVLVAYKYWVSLNSLE